MNFKDFDAIKPMPDTRWSLIARSNDGSTIVRRQALDELLRRYVPALQAHLILKRQIPPDQAHDLVQGFILDDILERSILAAADRARGRFRNLLLTALDNYARHQHRQANRLKRNPGQSPPMEHFEGKLQDDNTPPDYFEAAWTRQLLQRAIKTMEAQCRQMERLEVWEVFHGRILAPMFDNADRLSYDELVQRFKFHSPTQAANVLMTAKRTFARILRELILEYETPDAVEQEIDDLHRILAQDGAGSGPKRHT
jgi:hypothetical protein